MLKVKKPQKVGSKGTVLIPKKIRDRAGVKPNSQIVFSLNNQGKIVLEVIQDAILELQNMFESIDPIPTKDLIKKFKDEERKLEDKRKLK